MRKVDEQVEEAAALKLTKTKVAAAKALYDAMKTSSKLLFEGE